MTATVINTSHTLKLIIQSTKSNMGKLASNRIGTQFGLHLRLGDGGDKTGKFEKQLGKIGEKTVIILQMTLKFSDIREADCPPSST